MASFDSVNYALRPNKSIQRQIVFEGLRKLQALSGIGGIYVGFGSIWFTDFIAAHKLLAIDDMYSIEANDIGYARAKFNSPYAPIKIEHGRSTEVLPVLLQREELRVKPWTVWLDYDGAFSEEVSDDLRLLIERLPEDSILMTSFNAHEMSYGRMPERVDRLRTLFGDVFPDEIVKNDCKDERLLATLSGLTVNLMLSFAGNAARRGGFLPAFRITYRDGAPMVTVGGVLPSVEKADQARAVISAADWPCRPERPIITPNLTVREASVLQAMLPKAGGISRADVQAAGFDLEDEQVDAFVRYYRQYPAFAQIVT